MIRRLVAIILCLALAVPAAAQRDEAADRATIHALLVAYGSTLDARDFDGFARLFGTDGVYAAGTGMEARGTEAGAMMRRIFSENALGFKEPNFHLFFNEVVTFDGPDRAHATSMSLYMVPDESGRPTAALMARYEDSLARIDGHWLFARRTVKSLLPPPPAAPR